MLYGKSLVVRGVVWYGSGMIWYPYVQMKHMPAPYEITAAEGVYLYTKDAKLVDSVSSWWCAIHGYRNPVITEAMKAQADKFSHVMLGGLTHEPAKKLSDKLQAWLPGIWTIVSIRIPAAWRWRWRSRWRSSTL